MIIIIGDKKNLVQVMTQIGTHVTVAARARPGKVWVPCHLGFNNSGVRRRGGLRWDAAGACVSVFILKRKGREGRERKCHASIPFFLSL